MQEIQSKRTDQNGISRPIIVFFETLKKLELALQSEAMSEISSFVKVLSEEQSQS